MPTRKTLEMLNSFQCQCTMTPVKRRAEEYFVDFQASSRRLARCWLHAAWLSRWSNLHLQLVWRYSGHRARQMYHDHPSVAGILTAVPTPERWARQQGPLQGERHKRRHFPRITLEECSLVQITQTNWREVAPDRVEWKRLEAPFVEAHDPPWSSGRQLALPTFAGMLCE